VNANRELWEKGEFTQIASSRRRERLLRPDHEQPSIFLLVNVTRSHP
jgi:hypothetical protein